MVEPLRLAQGTDVQVDVADRGVRRQAVPRLAVALGQRSYPIAIGRDVLARAGELVPWNTKRAVVVTNAIVAAHHLSVLRASLDRAGVAIEEACGLTGFHRSGDRIEGAATARGDVSAEHYVLAAGAWSAAIAGQLGLRLPVQPGKGYSITMERPAVCPRTPCYLHERRVVATPWPSGYRLGGTMEFSGFSTTLNAGRIRALQKAAGEYLTDPVGRPVVEEWAGLRPMTYDDLPVIGRAPRLRNLILATGHGMLGITTAPATGNLVSEIVCGAPPHIDPEPFSVHRFQ